MILRYGIVSSGGGVSCAYSVGASLALVELGLTKPDFIICSSGSSGTFAYWTAGQYGPVRNIWENLLSTSKFVSLWRPGKIMDIDYLIDTVFKKQEPLRADIVKKARIKLFIGVTDYDSGEGVLWSNKDELDIFEVLRASKALPIAYNRKVSIGGKRYIDGDIAFPMYKKIEEAREIGFDKLIVINNENDSFFTRLALYFYSCFVPSGLKRTIRKNLKPVQIPVANNLIILTPKEKSPIQTLNNEQALIKEIIKIGFDDAIKNRDLLDLAKNIKYSNLTPCRDILNGVA